MRNPVLLIAIGVPGDPGPNVQLLAKNAESVNQMEKVNSFWWFMATPTTHMAILTFLMVIPTILTPKLFLVCASRSRFYAHSLLLALASTRTRFYAHSLLLALASTRSLSTARFLF
jgi:ABC-type microcin C transport system permease subunit YejB